MDTVYFIIGLFALAAMIGMYLLALVLQKKETPKFVAFIHGVFAALALIMLTVYYGDAAEGPGLLESIVLFVMAALGGTVLIIRDLTRKPLPKWLALAHGSIAVAGFIFLLVYACHR